jgi:hypothetical protein
MTSFHGIADGKTDQENLVHIVTVPKTLPKLS